VFRNNAKPQDQSGDTPELKFSMDKIESYTTINARQDGTFEMLVYPSLI